MRHVVPQRQLGGKANGVTWSGCARRAIIILTHLGNILLNLQHSSDGQSPKCRTMIELSIVNGGMGHFLCYLAEKAESETLHTTKSISDGK